ncbi:protein kibra isoform X1 [Nilaparvata lugens]|uniref:protein kibra isoform X1 n=1 Tax=Nilaparvata lugens TaxID=108931 RepID=UPI00193E6DFE|nr:protein kibra isoform X1 [Nilaparvata lugens]
MPRRRNGEIPLPEGWDFARDYDGKVYFIDHNSKKTTWIDPRDRFTKPSSFADCIGNELPLGWEEAFDPHIGVYYINHVNQCTQLEDPRLEWRKIQEEMLKEYLHTAQDVLDAKKEIYDIKQQRLHLAEDEYNHLNNALSTLNTSRTSLCSSSSSVSTKYDPDLLKSDVALARNRVSRLKRELEQIKAEMSCTQRGVETLTSVEQKLGSSAQGGCYNISEAQAIVAELREIQRSLSSGEQERSELMRSLAKLKDDLTRLQLSESSPDVSTLSLANGAANDKLSTASQTDLSGELVPMGTRLAEMARMRLEYDEARKRMKWIKQQLADLEEKVVPGQAESDKDRLLLFQEKEQLLRELRSITPRTRSNHEMSRIQGEIKKLEQDLNQAMELSNRAIADRLRLHEEKQLLLAQLVDALRSMTSLESRLRTLSASTLSVSSSSSLGSLSSATSSKGSLSSGLSFTDIYGGPTQQCVSNVQERPVDMVDLHRRVERLLRGSGGAGPEHPPPPAYESAPLSPISETAPLPPLAPVTPPLLPPVTPPLPVSAAVSDESVAGDSGVFEAASSQAVETAQVQIKLRYSVGDSMLHIGIERARNLSALFIPDLCQVYIKAALLPSGPTSVLTCCTKPISDLTKPRFGETFPLSVPLSKLCTKTLQVNVWSLDPEAHTECLGCAQVSLADFSPDTTCVKWYNILSFRFMQAPPMPPVMGATLPPVGANVAPVGGASLPPVGATMPQQRPLQPHKEESSDESTIISSQTSTLTRNQGCEGAIPPGTISLRLEELASEDEDNEEDYEDEEEEDEEDDDEEDDEEDEEDEEEGIEVYCPDELEQVLEMPDEEKEPCTEDKETNTECVFGAGGGSKPNQPNQQPTIVIKRSQTFSPVANANNHYICRLNRSDSDSSMPLYRRQGATGGRGGSHFQRNSVERRSLRWRRVGGSAMACHPQASIRAPKAPTMTQRTSLDLELDLQAQHSRLQALHDELARLRDLKARLEVAREKADPEVAAWVLEDTHFQNLVAQADGKSADDRKVEKLLKKTSREIYKLRKTKAGKGKPDLISFKEKMAFFTRASVNVPVPPPLSSSSESPLPSSDKESQRFEYTVDRTLGVEV